MLASRLLAMTSERLRIEFIVTPVRIGVQRCGQPTPLHRRGKPHLIYGGIRAIRCAVAHKKQCNVVSSGQISAGRPDARFLADTGPALMSASDPKRTFKLPENVRKATGNLVIGSL